MDRSKTREREKGFAPLSYYDFFFILEQENKEAGDYVNSLYSESNVKQKKNNDIEYTSKD